MLKEKRILTIIITAVMGRGLVRRLSEDLVELPEGGGDSFSGFMKMITTLMVIKIMIRMRMLII